MMARRRASRRVVNDVVQTTVDVAHGTSGVVGFIWRHRVGLGPFLTAIATALTGVLSAWLLPEAYAYVTFFIGTLLMLLWVKLGVSDREGKLHARRERVYLAIVALSSIGWVFMFYAYVRDGDISLKTAFIVLAWATGVLGIPWWWNLRRRSRVALENDLDAWPVVTKGTQLVNTYWTGFKKTADGWSGFLNIPPQLSRQRVLEYAELVEGLTNAPADSVVIEPAGRNSNKVHVTCTKVDPFNDAIVWDGRVLRTITEAAVLGRYQDRSIERTSWFEPDVGGYHRLIGGVARSGKSGLMHLLAALYGPADDVVIWSIDLKGGTTLLPWAPLADWTATTIDEAMVMMQCAAALVDTRSSVVARRGRQVADISQQMPAVVLMCDEIASLIGDSAPTRISRLAGGAMVEVARKGTAMGVLMVLATQYPTLAALKDSQLKSQLSWRACFRLSEPGQGRFILPNMTKGVDPYRIPVNRRGTCYIDAQGEFRSTTLRVEYVKDDMIRTVVERYWETTPVIDEASLAWSDPHLVAAYRKRVVWTPDMLARMRAGEEVHGRTVEDLYSDADDTNFDGVVDEHDEQDEVMTDTGLIETAVTAYLSADRERAVDDEARRQEWLANRVIRPEGEARRLLYQALDGGPPDGMRPAELARICGRTERTIHRWLEADRDNGKVIRLDYGRYVLVTTSVK